MEDFIKINRKNIPEFKLSVKVDGSYVFKPDVLEKIKNNTYEHYNVDKPIYECILSYVEKDKNCVDIGANIGLMTCYMLSCEPSHVTAIEPQGDLSKALSKSIKLNKWSNKCEVISKCVCADHSKTDKIVELGTKSDQVHWGFRYDGEHHNNPVLRKSSFIHIESILTKKDYSFLKMDTDNVDPELSLAVAHLIKLNKVNINAILCEEIDPKAGEILTDLGYSSFILPFDNWDSKLYPLYFKNEIKLKSIEKAIPVNSKQSWVNIMNSAPDGANFLFVKNLNIN